MKKFFYFIFIISIYNTFHAAPITEVIDKPGIYKYRATIISEPTDQNDAIITIASSNVVFDLDGYILMQHPMNSTAGLTGILIEPGVSNVAIRNGRVDHVTGCGIKISDGCQKIKIDNMVISNCNDGGILIDGLASGTGVDSVLMKDALLLSCTGSNGGPAFGLKAANVTALGIYDCFFNDNDAVTTSSGYGVWLDSCACVQFIRCVFTDNGGDALGAGCCITKSMNVCMQNCLALHNIARSTDSVAAGFYFDDCRKMVCLGCKCIETVNQVGKSIGFYSQKGVASLFQGCISEANDGGTLAAGFNFQEEVSSVVMNSKVIDNEATDGSGDGYGIYLEGTLNDKCHISENTIVGNKGGTKSRGIEDERTPSTSFLLGNAAFNNGVNYTVDYPLGINLPTINGSLSNTLVGLPSLSAGELDNIDVNP